MMVHTHVLNRTALGVRTPSTGSDVSDSDWPQAVASKAAPITLSSMRWVRAKISARKIRLNPDGRGQKRARMNQRPRRWLGTLSLAVILGTGNPPAKAAQQSGVDLKAFVGSWTQNPARSRGTISKDLTYTFSQE